MRTKIQSARRSVHLLLTLAIFAGGCTSMQTVRVKHEFRFGIAPEAKRETKIAILIDSTARDFRMEQKKSAMGFTTITKVPVGLVLSQASAEAIQRSFPVRVVDSAAQADSVGELVFQIRFGPGTGFKLGKTTLSKQEATIQLNGILSDAKRNITWETSVTETRDARRAGTAAAGALIGGILGGSMSKSAYLGALETAVRLALQASLEALLVQLGNHLTAPPAAR
ncbi:MAG: hypothetical protein Q8K82_15855 [Gemmatimonadaceae bacterium]|nr:hypothetical protein [Gemmatimonadaceae bacterium]